MKVKMEYLILVFIIAVLSIYLVVRKSGQTHYSLPEMSRIKKEDISRIQIIKGGATIVLVKENDKWLVGPKKFPADNALVDKMLDDISGLTLTALASESKNYAIYELGKEKRIEVWAYGGQAVLRKIAIGKSTSSYRHTFVRLDNDHRVFHSRGNLKTTFNKTVSELRSKKVMKFDEAITELILAKDREKITIVKPPKHIEPDPKAEQKEEQEPKPRWITDSGKGVKEKEVDEIIDTLSDLLCDSFIEDKKKEDFLSPVYTVSLKGIKTYTLSLFEKMEKKYAAVSSESDYPFLISEWKAKKIMKDPQSLKEEEK